MAVSATFTADFTSFFSAIEKSTVKLKGLDTDAGKVERSLNRLSDAYSGRRLIQEMTLTAEAIEKIGGKSKLTEAELEQVGRKAQEAVDKLRALGEDVPKNLQAHADAVKKPQEAIKKLGTDSAKAMEDTAKATKGSV